VGCGEKNDQRTNEDAQAALGLPSFMEADKRLEQLVEADKVGTRTLQAAVSEQVRFQLHELSLENILALSRLHVRSHV
jgi:hypothetical protein